MKINLQKLEDYSLSSSDIKKVLKGVKIIEYSQLSNFNNIDDVFDKEGRFILFFATEAENIGHWQCCFKFENSIIFFDSYGLNVDEAKKYVPQKLEIQLKEYPNYLSDLLRQSSYNVYHNSIKYQQMKGDITTCGKHSSFRLLNKKLNGQQYLKLMNSLKKNIMSKHMMKL